MNKLFSYLKETFENLTDIIRGNIDDNAADEDKMLNQQLSHHLLNQNCKNIVIASVVTAVTAFVHIIMAFVNKSNAMLIIGLLIVIAGSAAGFGLALIRLAERKIDTGKLKTVIYLYWLTVTAGMTLICVSDFQLYGYSYTYFVELGLVSLVPLTDIGLSAIIVGAPMAAGVISLFSCGADGKGAVPLIAAALIAFVISRAIFYLHCRDYINTRRLDTVSERCRQISEKDSATGMLNKNGLIKRLKESTSDSAYHQTIAAIFVDIDDFKGYNRLYGFEKSDKCLYDVCNCIRIISKIKTDIVSRFGGDEFIIVLEDTDEYELIEFAEQIRSSIETMALPFGNGIVTITVGVSDIFGIGEADYSKIISQAEINLDIAKNAGKNCISYKGHVFRKE